ncbi:MAG TPA: TIGR03085 family metal-binding protein [Acidimicrobiales bacterium]|nr:TIGR03085 family metal-binding protein [Acidimicrobiales bacterium]
MSSYARSERQELADLFLQVGPDAPTLCEGWAAADLAAHLVVRERRPDALAGIVIKPLSGYTNRVQAGVRARPWPELVQAVRSGPPFPVRVGAVDELVNAVEYFVHLEDLRRAQPEWEPRSLDPGLERMLWSRVKFMARMLRGRSPVGVTLKAPGFGEVVGKPGEPHVTVTGAPAELLLFVFGRQGAARVELDGDPAAVAQLRQAKLGF